MLSAVVSLPNYRLMVSTVLIFGESLKKYLVGGVKI